MVLLLCIAGGAGGSFLADSPPDANDLETSYAKDQPHESESEHALHAWHFAWGGTNVYPGLKISEAHIDKTMNAPLGLLLWDWEDPTTFKDWRDSGLLWEPYAGILKGLGPHWMVFVSGGEIQGTLRDSGDFHLLLIPVSVDIRFKRIAAYVTAGVDYYPWKRPDVEAVSRGPFSLRRSLGNAKPFLALGLTYMKQIEVGTAKLSLRGLGQIYRQEERFDYDFGHLTTRAGVEIPLSAKNTIAVSAGYAFCHPNGEEFSGPALGIFHTFRF